jgi:hypothetical protein
MKRRYRRRRRTGKVHGKKRSRANRVLKNTRKHRRVRRKKLIGASSRKAITDPRVARALGLMRREGVSASEAARLEKMKLKTFRQRAGRYLYRSGPGKPWKARSEDQLSFSMTVLTSRGPAEVIVRNLRERKLLHQYEFALRMFRAGEDGAEAALKAFKGKRVGGHTLITDIKILIELEEAGQLDYEVFYTSVGARA